MYKTATFGDRPLAFRGFEVFFPKFRSSEAIKIFDLILSVHFKTLFNRIFSTVSSANYTSLIIGVALFLALFFRSFKKWQCSRQSKSTTVKARHSTLVRELSWETLVVFLIFSRLSKILKTGLSQPLISCIICISIWCWRQYTGTFTAKLHTKAEKLSLHCFFASLGQAKRDKKPRKIPFYLWKQESLRIKWSYVDRINVRLKHRAGRIAWKASNRA